MTSQIAQLLAVALMLARAETVKYTYDAAGRLLSADYGNGKTIAYVYDKSGNLLSRTVGGVAPGPSFTAAGVVNAASFRGGAVAPGEMITIFGSGIGPAGGTRFLFDGVPAPIIYVSAGQSTVIVPCAVAGKSTTEVRAEYQGVQSPPVILAVAAAAPGLFTSSQNGSGQGAIVDQDGSINSPASPAPKGSVLLLLLTGDGQTNPPGVDGKLALDTLPQTAAQVSVTIGGVAAQVQYSGLASRSVAGFSQLNIVVPPGAPSGSAVPLVVTVGGTPSQPGVTLAIQ